MLLFDLTALQAQGKTQRHGGGKYAEIVFAELCRREFTFSTMWDSRRWINPDIVDLCKRKDLKMFDLSKITIDEIVKSNSITCIYSALLENGLISYQGCKIIGTVHGLRALEEPWDWMYLIYPWTMARKLKEVIRSLFLRNIVKQRRLNYYNTIFSNPQLSFVTVSNHTKYTIASYFPDVNVDKIKVFYSPSTSYPENGISEQKEDQYFLIVSANRPEKNSLRAIKALDNLFSQNKLEGYKVKITGLDKNTFNYRLKNPNNFEFLGYVDEKTLNNLFSNAYSLLYPSFTEGFGYPPLEAMRYGVPVLASPFTSITEICGGAALYYNPFSVEEIMNRILQITMSDVRERVSKESISRYKLITDKQEKDLLSLVDYIIANV